MSNARDSREWENNNPERRNDSKSVFSSTEEIGLMHYSTENYSTALEYLDKALENSEINDYPDRFRLYLKISDCQRKKGNYSESRKALDRAVAMIGEDPFPEDVGRVEYRNAFIFLEQGYYDEALKMGFNAYKRLKRSSEHSEVADIQILLANCYHRLGLAGEAEEFFMDALSSYRRIEDKVGIAYVYNNLALLNKNACRWNRALAFLDKSLEIAKNLGLTQHLIRVQLNLGIVHAKIRRFTDALSALSSAANMAERFGDSYKLTKAILATGRVYVQCGEYNKAEKFLVRSQAMANDLGYGRESALADEYLGELMIAKGKLREGLVNLNNGLRKARKIAPEGDITAEMLRRLADVHYLIGNYQKSLSYIEDGLEVAGNCDELYELGYFYRCRALCVEKFGDLDSAVEFLSTSVEMFAKHGNPYEKAASEQLLARIYIKKKDEENLLMAKHFINESIIDFSNLDDVKGQILSQVILASIELRLGHTDDALLAVFEADRLADEEQSDKFKRLLKAMRSRIEAQMTSATTRLIDQFTVLGDLRFGVNSREKLIRGLRSTLGLIVEKADAESGFIAIRNERGRSHEMVALENITKTRAHSLFSWYKKRISKKPPKRGIIITNPSAYPELKHYAGSMKVGSRVLVFQGLGFEGENLGCLFLSRSRADNGKINRERLNFIGAYASIISLSLFEYVRNARKQMEKPEPAQKGLSTIVTDNKEMLKLLNLAERVARSDATVLLEGETGTGKGLIAYAIHLLSKRRDKRFIHVNCAALPETLLESELFGHVRGAFTGAISEKEGLLSRANGGTIFLDEVGKTSLAMQGKLLQFLDTGKVRKVGSNEMIPVDVHVICASKTDLLMMCKEGRFLEDFYYRINDFPLLVPPLRERREDIPLLVTHYMEKISSQMGKIITGISSEAMKLLIEHEWPGNVRELEKVIKRAAILADDGDELDKRHFPSVLTPLRKEEPSDLNATLKQKIRVLEKAEIIKALKRNSWNKSIAARALGISYPSLLSKIKEYGIQ